MLPHATVFNSDGVEHRLDELRCRRLAVGAGNSHDGLSADTVREFEFADEFDVLPSEILDQRHDRVDAGAEDSEIVDGGVRFRRWAGEKGDSKRGEAFDFWRECLGDSAVEDRHAGVEGAQELRGAFAAFTCAEDGDMESCVVHRSFSVARPRSAQTKLTIQKRVTTAVSFQPLSSK